MQFSKQSFLQLFMEQNKDFGHAVFWLRIISLKSVIYQTNYTWLRWARSPLTITVKFKAQGYDEQKFLLQ